MLKVVLLLLVVVYTCQAEVYGQVNFLEMPKNSALDGPMGFRRVGTGNDGPEDVPQTLPFLKSNS
ncbi:hypothetical protein RR46_05259 [Papilio xuthus]|uniref:Uncharacterized protein n=1 Tax=Papilio xuthus TaxID=66420 RepID=A0A194Q6J1_PAPXU|nr:hypothetical protein RR46_05259 [Papilio xuthus]